MAFGLECQQKLVVRFFLTEEGRVERLSPRSLFHQLGIIYSSKYFAASVVSKSGFFVSTPRKIFPRAVDRNKIKRTLKGAYRDVLRKEWEFANSLIDEFNWDRETFGLRFVVKEKFLSLKYDQVYNEVLNVVMEIPKTLKQ